MIDNGKSVTTVELSSASQYEKPLPILNSMYYDRVLENNLIKISCSHKKGNDYSSYSMTLKIFLQWIATNKLVIKYI